MFTIIALLLSAFIVLCMSKGTHETQQGKWNHWDRIGSALVIPTLALWSGIGVTLLVWVMGWLWRHAP